MSQHTPAALTEGAVFHGRYQILRCLKAGGMGAVYVCVHLTTRKQRALKVMLPQVVASPGMRERFELEARVTAEIESDHIVETFDAGVDEATGAPFLVMELLRGDDLDSILQSRGPFTAETTVTLLSQVALALDKTHAAGIVHRDLKPQNLFLTTRDDGSPRIKILDFGIAKVVADGSRTVQQTAAIGTPVYMAPEQAMGDGHIGAPADLYALAHIAYAMLAGDAYWMEEKQSLPMYPFLTKMLAGASEPPSARAARRGVALPAGFDAWFARATAREPRHRFDRASTQISELAAALGTPAPRTLLGAPPPLGHRLPGPGSMPTPAELFPASSQPHVGSLPSGAVAAASQPISQPLGTNPSGMVAPPGASVGTMRAVLSPADPAPTAKRSAGSLVAGAILILAVGIGATVVVMRLGKQSPQAASAPAPATATALPAPTATAQAAAPSAKPTVSAAETTEEAGAPTASATVPPKPTAKPTQHPPPPPKPTANPPAAPPAPFDPTRMR